MARLISLSVLICLQLACASIRHSPVSGDDKEVGIRYYESAPYLLVYSDSKGGIKTQILHLPDQTRLLSAHPKSKLASLKSTLKFQNGVLTSSEETIDTTAVPSAILDAVKTIVPSLIAAIEKRGDEVPAPYLYKIVVYGEEVFFYGSQGGETIRVKLSATSASSNGGGQ